MLEMDRDLLSRQFDDVQIGRQSQRGRMYGSRGTTATTSSVGNSESFGISDDLSLDMYDVSSSSTAGLHVALEDANTRMREEIRELRDETGRLRKVLGEKDYDIKRLNKKFMKMEDDKKLLASAGVATDTAATKIVELSKRNRELTAEMEAEKAKSLKLLKQLLELEKNQDQEFTPRKKLSPKNTLALHPEIPIQNIDELQEKLQSTQMKMTEYRNQIQELKQELKVAYKVLQQEIGEAPTSMQSILSGGSGFRGRAQQILALQDKVKDLEKKLSISAGLGSLIKPDKNLERIKNMEKQKKEQTEAMRAEIVKCNELNGDLQRKLDATKARNKVLTNEMKSMKSQVSILTEKGKHDNELVTTLMRQHENLQRIVEHNVTAKESLEKAGVVFNKELLNKQAQEQAEIGRLKQLLAERDERLRILEQELMEERSSAKDDGDDGSMYRPLAVFTSPSRTSLNQKNGSPDQISLQPSGEVSTSSQEIEELRKNCAKYEALYNSSAVEQQKLSELVSILSKRVDALTMNCQESNKRYQDERRKTAKIEHNFEQMKLSLKQDASDGHLQSARISSSQVPPEARLSELETMLGIQTDENAALKESLESTLRAKQEDVNLFHEMMEQTKSVFLDALRNLTKNH